MERAREITNDDFDNLVKATQIAERREDRDDMTFGKKKNMRKAKINLKKCLTKGEEFGNIVKRLARGARANLENDTESKETQERKDR